MSDLYTQLLLNRVNRLSNEVLSLSKYKNLYYDKDKECAVLEAQLKNRHKALTLATGLVVLEAVALLIVLILSRL